MPPLLKKTLVILALLACLLPQAEPRYSLALGIAMGLAGITAWPGECKKYARLLMQSGIVCLGLWISLGEVGKAGLAGLGFSAGAIVVALLAALGLERLMRPAREVSVLLSAGTAICGGSAIAATGTVIHASAGAIAVCTGIVFLLNACGVYLYPLIGHALELSPRQYGAWSAVGVHDVAGVLAAARGYDEAGEAFKYATIIKLTRVLWIVPVALALGWWYRRAQHEHTERVRTPFPTFIVLFVLAVLVRGALDHALDAGAAANIGEWGKTISGRLLTLALLLTGLGISVQSLRQAGWRAIVTGVTLWVIVSGAALAAARAWM